MWLDMGLGAGSSTTQTNSAQTSPMTANQDAARSAQLYQAANPTNSIPNQAAGKGLAARTPLTPTGGYFQGWGQPNSAPFGGIQIGDPFSNQQQQQQQPMQPMQPAQPQQQLGMRNIQGNPFYQNRSAPGFANASPQDSNPFRNWMGIQLAMPQQGYSAQHPFSMPNVPLFNGQLGRMLYLPT